MSNEILTEEQVETIINILTQYMPDDWTALKLHLFTDEDRTELTTWTETKSVPEYGFNLDPEDRLTFDDLIETAWEASGRAWNTLDLSVTADGAFELSAQ